MQQVTGYIVLDAFLEPIRSYSIDQLDQAKMFCYTRPDCTLTTSTINLYDLLGECLL